MQARRGRRRRRRARRSQPLMRCSNRRRVSGSGSKITVPASPSTSANAGGRPFHDNGPSPTTMGAPRARASIATCEEGEPAASAMAPPRVQSAARKAEGVMSSAATIEPPVILRDCVRAAQMREHAIADVDDIRGTGTEIFVFSRAIACDLHVECRAPGMVGSDPRRDGLVCRHPPAHHLPASRPGIPECRPPRPEPS